MYMYVYVCICMYMYIWGLALALADLFLINHPVSRTYVRVSLSCPVCVCVLERACVVHRFVVHVAVVRQDRRYPGRHRHRRGREFRCHRFVAVGLGGNEEQVKIGRVLASQNWSCLDARVLVHRLTRALKRTRGVFEHHGSPRLGQGDGEP